MTKYQDIFTFDLSNKMITKCHPLRCFDKCVATFHVQLSNISKPNFLICHHLLHKIQEIGGYCYYTWQSTIGSNKIICTAT